MDSHKFLGLHIDSDLKFRSHVASVCRKLLAGAAILARLRAICTIKLKRNLYFSLFESNVRYMLPIYGGTNDALLSRVVRLQKRALRSVASAHRIEHTGPLLTNLAISHSQNCMPTH